MRTTITIDDTLFEEASAAADETNASALVAKALETLVSIESSKRLLKLSGKAPTFSVPERSARTLPMVAEGKATYNVHEP